ncbi:MAG TPA: tripartite tricarboxylate transporter substrate binding protein [Burkholderiales bacterium]|nr:tripartite tricarboxylate transporter substrate binding protein [Burkholderiales bacterium]
MIHRMTLAGFRAGIALFAALISTNALAASSWQPNRNVEIVVSTSPGSGSDTTARFIQKLLVDNKLVAVPVTVMNKPGGGGAIGATYLNQHAGNGHYVMVTSPSLLANEITGRTKIKYTDVTPLAQLGTEPVVFTVRADSPMKNARELAERLKAKPDSLSFSIGTTMGSHNHIAVAQLAKAVGVNPKTLKVLAFGGSADGITALLGGHIEVVASPASGVWEHYVAKKLRILAVSSESRLDEPLSDIPTWKELGYPVISANWRSVVGPKGLPEEQVRYWDEVFAKLSKLPEWKQSLDSEHMMNTYSNSRGTRELMDAQHKAMSATLAELGLVK